ncbi:TadE/TadG family type IV pilus assembly protein [Paraburkholderia lycopersici]|uniref:Flp pilus assembly protein TadG n=1 Tax=Paraburkholderia lycopersici TaxID=416944 RepID=A0A1G6W0J8_9BURK|nr:TadE/TadG family type IV pilus assembly protein [Paraburkholderia lycopersici]SDD59412.1 Flp pilus assembly protein TadG [Paraburkholderia lycopersici]
MITNLATLVRSARLGAMAVLAPCRKYLAGRDRGAVSLVFAISASVMLGALSMSIDLGRYAISQARMQSALDAANLAASVDMGHYGSTACPTNLTAWQSDALKYYSTNMPGGYLDLLLSSSNFTATCTNNSSGSGGQVVQLSATGELPLMMPSFLASNSTGSSGGSTGGNDMQVGATDQVTRIPQSTLELALVLDNTGSMAQTPSGSSTNTLSKEKIYGLQTAATTLVTQLFGQSGASRYYIGIVPFASTVNVGMAPPWLDGNGATISAALSPGAWLNQTFSYNPTGVSMSGSPKVSLSNGSWAWSGSGWGGCTAEPRDGAGNLAALAYSPSATTASTTSPYIQFTPYYYNVPPGGLTVYTSQYWLFGLFGSCTSSTIPGVPATVGSGSEGTCSTNSSVLPISAWNQTSSNNAYTLNQNNMCIGTPVTFLTNDSKQLKNAINAMQPAGSTIIPTGLLWGWRMLSSNWAGTWNQRPTITTPLPLPESTLGLQRVIILMTDGENDVSSSNIPGQEVTYFNGLSGVGTNSLQAPSVASPDDPGGTLAGGKINLNDINSYQAAVCTAIKSAGITIYTIAFGSGAAANTGLQSCASPGDYYSASSNSALNTVFQQIATNIGVLRLTQ